MSLNKEAETIIKNLFSIIILETLPGCSSFLWGSTAVLGFHCFMFLILNRLICEGAFQHRHPSGDQRGASDLRGNSARVLWRVHRTTSTRKTFKQRFITLLVIESEQLWSWNPVMFSNQGIVIEFLDDSGLIKCTQNPQLYFHMSEVIEKKKLELNEKVEFSVVPVSPPRSPLKSRFWRLRPFYRRFKLKRPQDEKLQCSNIHTQSWWPQVSLIHHKEDVRIPLCPSRFIATFTVHQEASS